MWWICEKGHEWQASIANRSKGRGCPICANRYVLPNRNDLASLYPALAQEWHPNKNGGLLPTDVVAGTERKIWWQCKYGHEWQATIYNRIKGQNCPYCANRKVLTGYNDLATVYPQIAAEWHPTKNGLLLPLDVIAGSGKKVWWICKEGHEWLATVVSRTKGNNCPYCSNKKLLKGYNDLATVYPQIAAEWHPTKNGDLLPSEVNAGSEKKVWWLCKNGHEWQSPIIRRRHHGCPYCSGRNAVSGVNDILSQNVLLATEWNREKNGIDSSKVSIRSGRVYWWKCSKCGYEWQASPHNRTNGSIATGCPKCALETQTSYPEQVVYYFIKKHYSDAINRYRDIFWNSMELDIFIPSIKTGIEYDGENWHNKDNSREKEIQKYQICKANEVKLIRIREDADQCENETCDYAVPASRHPSNTQLRTVLHELAKIIPLDDEFDIEIVENDIRASYISISKENSLEILRPSIAKYWNYPRNGGLVPSMVSLGSNNRVWWICDKGHEWQSTVSSMVSRREKYPNSNGCPYCSKQRVIPGETDLETCRPELAAEWNYNKNGELKPSQISCQSNKKVWWICKEGHEWEAVVGSRYRGNGCPICGNKARQKKKQKAVKNLDTGEVFVSSNEAAKQYGVSASAIAACCLGRIKTCKGYHWIYNVK